MATNDFQPFAYGGAANVVSQSAYIALTSILQNGFSSGVAQSAQLNKVWRQSSIMAAVLAQFSSDYSGQNSTDDGTTATLETNLIAAIRSVTKTGVILTDTGAANAYTAVNVPPLVAGTWIDGVVQQVKIAHANTSASTYAPDGLTAIPIYGLGLQPLQGGELALNGTAVLMHATIAGVNGGNPICVLMECAGGAQQIAPATQSQHAVQLGQVAVFGSARNLKASLAAAGTSLTFTADAIVVKSALNGISTLLTSYSETLNIATTGAGGMDTGSAPASGYVAVYASWGAVPGAGIFAQDATSAVAPEQYGGTHAPSGVTETQLIGVWSTNGSGQLTVGSQRNRRHSIIAQPAFTSAPATGYTAVSLSTLVPKNAISVGGTIDFTGTSGVIIAYLAGDASGTGEAHASFNGGQGASCPFHGVPLITAQTIFRALSGTGSSQTVYISEYEV